MRRSTPDLSLITVSQLAAYLQVTRQTIWRWVKEGRLPPPQRIGARSSRWTPGQLAGVIPGLAPGGQPPEKA
jgi:excisionase family DNA binding protein